MNKVSKHIGIVKFFNVGRLYGFITDMETGNEYFCHNNGLACHIKKGDKVTFELAECSRDYHNAGTLAGISLLARQVEKFIRRSLQGEGGRPDGTA